jgi:hypothetical protein
MRTVPASEISAVRLSRRRHLPWLYAHTLAGGYFDNWYVTAFIGTTPLNLRWLNPSSSDRIIGLNDNDVSTFPPRTEAKPA